MTACLPNESIFLLLMLCIYTHCNLPYKPQRREERERERKREREREREGGREGWQRGRETETEQASEREEKKNRKKTEKGTDKALLPDSRQPSFPYSVKCNSSNAATGSVLPD